MLVSGKHTPRTTDHTGIVPPWIISKVGEDAVDALYMFPYSQKDKRSTRKVVKTVQKYLVKLGYGKIYGVNVTGKLDEPTVLAMKHRMGPSWELYQYKDIIHELQVYVDREDYYALGAEEDEKKDGGFPILPLVAIVSFAALMLWSKGNI